MGYQMTPSRIEDMKPEVVRRHLTHVGLILGLPLRTTCWQDTSVFKKAKREKTESQSELDL
jgi:hypothetical protein